MDYMAAVVLEKQLTKNIEQLEIRSKAENKNLTQKKSPNGISIVEAFNVDLEITVSEVLVLNIPFLKTFAGRKPTSIKEFIRFSGGLSTSINKLIEFRTKDSRDPKRVLLQKQDDEVIEYVDVIERMLVKAKGKTPQRLSSDKIRRSYTPLALPFCALCYKRVNQSSYFCREHHSSRNALIYKKATRRLISAVYRYSNDESETRNLDQYKQGNLMLGAQVLYRWLALFSVQPRVAIGRLNKVDQTKSDWRCYAKVILEFTQSSYPVAYEVIQSVELNGSASFELWIIEVARALGGEVEANLWKLKDTEIWLDASNDIQRSLTILNCISRYEAAKVVDSFPIKTGSLKGSRVDVDKRELLKKLLIERDNDSSITMEKIAERMGVSRTAIYKLKNKME